MQISGPCVTIISENPDQFKRASRILDGITCFDKIHFHLALGATEISNIEGASAAGASAAARQLTPRLDAEALVTGRTALGQPLPASPAGITSPAVITRACLSVIDHKINIIDCGTFAPPQLDHQSTSGRPGRNIAEQDSMDISQVYALFAEGQSTARKHRDNARLDVLAECVPGGTTTALGVLRALGFAADNLLSSSIPGKKGTKQKEIVDDAFSRLNQSLGAKNLASRIKADPLTAIGYFGDPMQAFACGFIIESLKLSLKQSAERSLNNSSKQDTTYDGSPGPLILAGGSQMLAVYALASACIKAGKPGTDGDKVQGHELLQLLKQKVVVATTKYVACDPFADTKTLAALVDAPYVASSLNLNQSSHIGLRAYEKGHVKEGVGAGASLVLASLIGKKTEGQIAVNDDKANLTEGALIDLIDLYYQAMVLEGSVLVTSV